eukprot:CAMPEP_0171705608 /NCGR_PEP_ID=MMETSP0991-20121206/13289_1 /TAXON_ID=483369 /ORGANISM="non described non described, Strain CCMP2098" /LENGTH=51 /DNA_ID=CAMNT_0012295167 /DNA_START=521 /DNA_END=672 /DNA_ORIENTATION=-
MRRGGGRLANTFGHPDAHRPHGMSGRGDKLEPKPPDSHALAITKERRPNAT